MAHRTSFRQPPPHVVLAIKISYPLDFPKTGNSQSNLPAQPSPRRSQYPYTPQHRIRLRREVVASTTTRSMHDVATQKQDHERLRRFLKRTCTYRALALSLRWHKKPVCAGEKTTYTSRRIHSSDCYPTSWTNPSCRRSRWSDTRPRGISAAGSLAGS